MQARYRYRLRVNSTAARELQDVFDSCRFVWNHALGRWNDLWEHERCTYKHADASKELTDLRHTFDWLSATPCGPQQMVLRDLFHLIDAYFDMTRPDCRKVRYKPKGTHSTAKWKRHSFSVEGDRLSLGVRGGKTCLGGRTTVTVVTSRPLPSEPSSVTVYRDASGRWWASFVVDVEPNPVGSTGFVTGLDVGISTLATTEDPAYDIPRRPNDRRTLNEPMMERQKRVKRSLPGSGNHKRARQRLRRMHGVAANQRRDYAHKSARRLARRFDVIGVEDLKIARMAVHQQLRYPILDAGWGQFLLIIEWHAQKCGHEVIRINPRDTTQTCSECGVKAKRRLGLGDRIFRCSECCLVLDRDRNAARNLNPNRQGKTGESATRSAIPTRSGVANRVRLSPST